MYIYNQAFLIIFIKVKTKLVFIPYERTRTNIFILAPHSEWKKNRILTYLNSMYKQEQRIVSITEMVHLSVPAF